MFSRGKKLQKQLKETRINNARAQRELQRDQRQLQRNEAQLEADIRRLAAQGDEKSCALLAKQLVKNRRCASRTKEMSSLMLDITAQQRMFASNARIASVAKTGTSMMTKMNKQMDKDDIIGTMQGYSKECMKMSMKEEALNDALDSIFDDNEEEEDAAIQQILVELGAGSNAKMLNAPKQPLEPISDPVADQDSDDITAQLERLRSS